MTDKAWEQAIAPQEPFRKAAYFPTPIDYDVNQKPAGKRAPKWMRNGGKQKDGASAVQLPANLLK